MLRGGSGIAEDVNPSPPNNGDTGSRNLRRGPGNAQKKLVGVGRQPGRGNVGSIWGDNRNVFGNIRYVIFLFLDVFGVDCGKFSGTIMGD